MSTIQTIGAPQVTASAPTRVANFSRSESPVVPSPSVADRGSTDTTQPSQQAQPPNREQAEDAVKRIKEFVQPINDSIQFSLDDDTGFTVVKVIDLQTKEVLRQIPSEEAIHIAKALDKLKGLLIQSKA